MVRRPTIQTCNSYFSETHYIINKNFLSSRTNILDCYELFISIRKFKNEKLTNPFSRCPQRCSCDNQKPQRKISVKSRISSTDSCQQLVLTAITNFPLFILATRLVMRNKHKLNYNESSIYVYFISDSVSIVFVLKLC